VLLTVMGHKRYERLSNRRTQLQAKAT
jgi:hypothetical protein